MVREMLNYLIVASADNRPELCKKIMVGRRRDRQKGFARPRNDSYSAREWGAARAHS